MSAYSRAGLARVGLLFTCVPTYSERLVLASASY